MPDKLIFALIGALVGGIASGLFVGAACCKTYRQKIEELEAENERLRHEQRHERARELSDREEKARLEEADVDTSLRTQLTRAREERQKAEKIAEEAGYSSDDDEEEADLDYSDEEISFNDPFAGEDEVEVEENGDVVVKKPVDIRPPVFSLMTQEDYESDFEYRESEQLTYYPADHVLADAFDEKVNHPERIIGQEGVSAAETSQEKFVYVLDEVIDKMYEIEINHEESYYRDILRGGEL